MEADTDTLAVLVTGVTPPPPFATVVVFHGVHEELGEVSFAVDHRPARMLATALKFGEQPVAEVPTWALLEVQP